MSLGGGECWFGDEWSTSDATYRLIFAIGPFLTLYDDTMDVGNDGVGVGNAALKLGNALMNIGNERVGVHNTPMNVGNDHICVYC